MGKLKKYKSKIIIEFKSEQGGKEMFIEQEQLMIPISGSVA